MAAKLMDYAHTIVSHGLPKFNVKLHDSQGSHCLTIYERRVSGGYNVFITLEGQLAEVAWVRKRLKELFPDFQDGGVQRQGIGWFKCVMARPLVKKDNSK